MRLYALYQHLHYFVPGINMKACCSGFLFCKSLASIRVDIAPCDHKRDRFPGMSPGGAGGWMIRHHEDSPWFTARGKEGMDRADDRSASHK